MSNNYKMNLAVAYHLDLDYNTTSNEAGDLFVVVNGEVFDPCNNITQAWPIMMENDISIQIEPGAKPAAIKGMRHTGSGEYFDTFTFELMGCNDNPLVAAMAVLVGEEC